MEINSTLRKTDEKCADIVSAFLDKHFYNTVSDFERVFDKKRQVKGIDTIFKLSDETYDCDEKAAIRYVNKCLKTFSMELSFLNRKGEPHDGWLIDQSKTNNSFLFIWIDKAKNDILTCEEDIQEIEIALVKRDKIIDYLSSLGWTLERLSVKCNKLRNDSNEEKGDIYKNGVKFVVSNGLVEQPVNILISRKKLKEISDITKKFVNE